MKNNQIIFKTQHTFHLKVDTSCCFKCPNCNKDIKLFDVYEDYIKENIVSKIVTENAVNQLVCVNNGMYVCDCGAKIYLKSEDILKTNT